MGDGNYSDHSTSPICWSINVVLCSYIVYGYVIHLCDIGCTLRYVTLTTLLCTLTLLEIYNIYVAHHFFAVWNGDRRLRDKYGDKADLIRERTSIIPFAAIITGKQPLPDDYYKEFLRLPYLVITVGCLGAYYAHPFMQAGATLLHW
jgi:uncharacterized membrane protein